MKKLAYLKNALVGFATWSLTGAALAGMLFWGVPQSSQFVTPAWSLTSPPTQAPRQFPWQMTHYIRFAVQANPNLVNSYPCVIVSTYCTIKIAALPYNSMVLRIYTNIGVAFNSNSSDQISIGTTATSASNTQIMGLASVASTANLTSQTIGTGVQAALGQGTVQSGTDGGFDVYVTYKQVGSPAATTGEATFIIEYVAPNDGACQPVPMAVQPGTTTGTNVYGQQYC